MAPTDCVRHIALFEFSNEHLSMTEPGNSFKTKHKSSYTDEILSCMLVVPVTSQQGQLDMDQGPRGTFCLLALGVLQMWSRSLSSHSSSARLGSIVTWEYLPTVCRGVQSMKPRRQRVIRMAQATMTTTRIRNMSITIMRPEYVFCFADSWVQTKSLRSKEGISLL